MASSRTTYRCDECGKNISRRCDLGRHMKLHASNAEDLKIPCPYQGCDYRALQRSNLKTHMFTHTGERPYKCPYEGCGFDTRDPGALTRHRKRAHGYVPKGNTGNKTEAPNGASRTTHEGSRFTPYDTSIRRSGSTTNVEVSHQLPADDACPESSDVDTEERAQLLKNTTLAFETELAQMLARANDSNVETNVEATASPSASWLPLTQPEVPTAEEMSPLDWQDLFTFNQIDEHVPQPDRQSDDELDRFLANYDKHMANASSSHNTISNPDAATPTAYQTPTLNTVDDAVISKMHFLPYFNTQDRQYQNNRVQVYSTNHGYYGQPVTSYAGQAPYNSYTRGAPTHMGVCPPGQTMATGFFNHPTYLHAAPLNPGAFHGMGSFFAV